ncbi:uncharacterized protein LOC130622889 isoform X1 [Hydractinia symbiolongicarpus]|uniref:uncharacterized protein LOC130622889 isoform X1 n=1 Tax=Hydractinia symbiolongicarpus TaxID=13093 RepID=UPI00254BCFA7|nr:uncharacterized protein LOC130622889 isoform X1 [Hydractinia symbiolongicarpus]XP_057294331.1 uncharacterized protein LOC130622889 isoform X1 [Hydractinia symbiolongicarpus]XP_057294332.1 uncharacterized protein LOC130622889 isoform X1 [Hydractinia symbiolongicarpus]
MMMCRVILLFFVPHVLMAGNCNYGEREVVDEQGKKTCMDCALCPVGQQPVQCDVNKTYVYPLNDTCGDCPSGYFNDEPSNSFWCKKCPNCGTSERRICTKSIGLCVPLTSQSPRTQATKKPNKSPARETTTKVPTKKVPTKKVPTKKVTQETTFEKSSSTTILPVPTEIDTTLKTLIPYNPSSNQKTESNVDLTTIIVVAVILGSLIIIAVIITIGYLIKKRVLWPVVRFVPGANEGAQLLNVERPPSICGSCSRQTNHGGRSNAGEPNENIVSRHDRSEDVIDSDELRVDLPPSSTIDETGENGPTGDEERVELLSSTPGRGPSESKDSESQVNPPQQNEPSSSPRSSVPSAISNPHNNSSIDITNNVSSAYQIGNSTNEGTLLIKTLNKDTPAFCTVTGCKKKFEGLLTILPLAIIMAMSDDLVRKCNSNKKEKLDRIFKLLYKEKSHYGVDSLEALINDYLCHGRPDTKISTFVHVMRSGLIELNEVVDIPLHEYLCSPH